MAAGLYNQIYQSTVLGKEDILPVITPGPLPGRGFLVYTPYWGHTRETYIIQNAGQPLFSLGSF